MLEKSREAELKKKAQNKDKDGLDSVLQARQKNDLNAKVFSLLGSENQALDNWKKKLDIPNTTKASKGRLGGLDPSAASGVMTFPAEASERRSKIGQAALSEEQLNKQFRDSEILGDQDKADAKMLYLGIPELEQQIFDLELKKTFKNSVVNASEILRIFQNSPLPSIFLMQIGTGPQKRVFGGYANESWSSDQSHFGGPTCFLFLFTQADKVKLRENPNPPSGKSVILWHSNHSLSFGQTDLVLGEDGYWTSEVDNNYLSGKNLSNDEKRTFLSGTKEFKFKPEIFEIWQLRPTKQ